MVEFANRPSAVILVAGALLIALVAFLVLGSQLPVDQVVTASWRRGG